MITYIDALALESQIADKVMQLNNLLTDAANTNIKVDIQLIENNMTICCNYPTQKVSVNCTVRPSDIKF